ncbi:LPXTG cell wall anchor domain-containing protein [Staphylococcus lugdunensis]
MNSEGNEVQETEEGTHQPPGIIGDKWQYTGRVTEKDGITTYVYERIQSAIPNEAPQETPVQLEITRYVDGKGNEVQETTEGKHEPPGIIGDRWQYTGQTTTADGITTYVYERIQSEIPNEAPQETPVQLEVTRYVDITGNEVQETEEGTHQPRYIIGDKWRYSGVTVTENGITKHVYERIQSKVPNDAPQETPVQLEVTRYVDPEGNEIQETTEGKHQPPGIIGDRWQYTGKVTEKDGIITYVYERIQSEIPNNPPQETPVELEVTRYVDGEGNEVQETTEGKHQPPSIIGDRWQYTGKVTEKDGITTYVYERIQSEIPNNPPQETPVQLEVTRYVDPEGNEVQETTEGKHQPPSIIGDRWQYTGKVTEKDGITTYVYERIQSKVPNDAPRVDIDELKITIYVDTNGREIVPSRKGQLPPEQFIGQDWQYTGHKIEKDGITTYIYKKVENAVPAKQLKKTKHNTQSESQFKHTPQVKQQLVKYHNVKEQRSIEKSEHTDMHVSELPETGETANKNGLIGGLLIAIGAFFVTKRKKKTQNNIAIHVET